MKPTILAMTALGLLLAACGEPATPAAVTPPAPEYANNWYAAEGQTPGGVLNIHETKLGLAGFVREPGGEFQPIRKVVLTDGAMSFIVPALDATWEAAKAADGSWTGKWTTGGTSTDLVLKLSVAPEISSKFVTFEDGRWTELKCQGAGAPTVILDYGAGGAMAVWKDVFEPISRITQTCMYERAGRGLSDPGPMPRDVNNAVADIDALIRAAKIEGPVVLVGHSMASYHVRQFANLHGDDTAGIVLIDPSGDGQTARFTKLIPNLKELVPESVDDAAVGSCAAALREKLLRKEDEVAMKCGGNDPDRTEATLSEIASMEVLSTGEIKAAVRPYGDLPLIVLTRSDYDKGMPDGFTAQNRKDMAQVWTQMHEEMMAQSTAGQHRVIPASGHFIQGDQPQAVIEAVSDVLTAARARARAAR